MACVRVWGCLWRGLLGCAFLMVWLLRLLLVGLGLLVAWGCCRCLLAGVWGSRVLTIRV